MLTRRLRATCAAAVLALLVVCAPVRAAGVLPDLVSDPPYQPDGAVIGQALSVDASDAAGQRLLLRFSGYIHNAGAGPVEIKGTSPLSPTELVMGSVVQRIRQDDGSMAAEPLPAAAELRYETNDSHDHWHLQRVARYSLVNASGALVAPSMKVGFCLTDSQLMSGSAPIAYPGSCGTGQQSLDTEIVEGISAGWRDIYGFGLAFQWVDVSDTQPGVYALRSEVDPATPSLPGGIIRESDEVNPPVADDNPAIVPGYVARPVALATVAPQGPTRITLAADAFHRPGYTTGPRQFRVVTAPRHGTLDVPVGTWFDGSDVVYTPDAAPAADSFEVEARSATSPFPRTPVRAAVTVGVADGVVVSGAPQSLPTGMSAQLAAVTTGNARAPVAWSVPGGGAFGTVSPNGLFVAPGEVPPGGTVTVRARTASGETADVTIGVTMPAPQVPAPLPPVAEPVVIGGPKRSPLVLSTAAARRGKLVAISARSSRMGVLKVSVLAGKRSAGRCALVVRANRTYSCRVRPKRGRGVLTARFVLTTPDRKQHRRTVAVGPDRH